MVMQMTARDRSPTEKIVHAGAAYTREGLSRGILVSSVFTVLGAVILTLGIAEVTGTVQSNDSSAISIFVGLFLLLLSLFVTIRQIRLRDSLGRVLDE